MKWQEPPPKRLKVPKGRSAEIDAMVAELKSNPNTWALVVEGAKSAGSASTWKRRGLETRTTYIEGGAGACDIYARYVEPDPKGLSGV